MPQRLADDLLTDRTRLVETLELDALERGQTHRVRVLLTEGPLGRPTWVPAIVARGAQPGPVLAVTAAMHGNELNGISLVQRLLRRLRPRDLRGTVIGVPVVNGPGLLRQQREYFDGEDLNRLMPGRADGNCAEVFAHRFVTRIVARADYLIDLHTASFGRVNSLYIRADLTDEVMARMAHLQEAQVVVHNTGGDGTLRAAAADLGIHAITVEIGDPMRFQRGMIRDGLSGVENVLADLDMLPGRELTHEEDPIMCERSYWIYSDRGGFLEVLPDLVQRVEAGEQIARVQDVFGDKVCSYKAPETGVVIGKSTNPINYVGSRVLHLGIIGVPAGAADTTRRLAELRRAKAPEGTS